MNQATGRRLSIGMALLLAGACRNDGDAEPQGGAFTGVSLAQQPLLAAGCSLVTGMAPVMTVTVKDGETAYVAFRPSDSKVTVNGNIFSAPTTDTGNPCEIASTGTINIVADTTAASPGHTLGRSVILDYINGLFMTAASATTPAIKIDYTLTGDTGVHNALKVRGSDGAENFAFGAGGTNGAALNVNAQLMTGVTTQVGGTGGGTVTLDGFADVTFKNIPTVVISAGAGNDHIDATGVTLAGVGTAFATAVSLYGGGGDDTISGGLGDDMLVGGSGNDTLNGCQGNDTYDMGTAPAGDDIIAEACTASAEGTDTLDYSKRTGNLTVALSHSLSTATTPATDAGGTSGESGELAHISDKIVNIKLGAGDDSITIPTGSTVLHKIKGGKGDDTFTGNGAADVFDGEVGDDSCVGANPIMDYSARTNAVNVSACASGCSATTDNNDGDQSPAGSSHSRTAAAATTAAGGAPLSVLTGGAGFTSSSPGNTITFSNCAGGTTDQASFPIVEYVSANSVKIDTTSVAGFVADTCDFSEAHPDATTNSGAGATLAAKVVTGTVTGLDHTANMLYHTLQLTHSAASTGGGGSHSNDDGTYIVVRVIDTSSVAIDNFSPTALGTTYAGGVSALDWVETGSEHDNVQCANITGGSGNDTIIGDSRVNSIHGGAGNDTLNGGAANDNLFGEDGDDSLFGGPGSDTLSGGEGTDLLFGGDGNDVLAGGNGTDTFTCDGRNSSTSLSSGTSPGDSDIALDLGSGDLTGVTPTDCEP
jgi:Ca2+-binding RTX toxin-like protein